MDALVKWKERIIHFLSQFVTTSEPFEALVHSSQAISLRLVHSFKQKKRKSYYFKQPILVPLRSVSASKESVPIPAPR